MIKSTQKVLGVIPARLGSTRIPKKMLADVHGKSLIERTIERSKKAQSLDRLIVSTDSEEIAEIARSCEVDVYMTDSDIPTGTDRVAATVGMFNEFIPDIVVNIWGDEPLYGPEVIDNCVQRLIDDKSIEIVAAADRIMDEKMVSEPSIVQVLTDKNDNALFFTRATVPYPHQKNPYDHYHVIGALALRRSFIEILRSLTQTPIESVEGVEQMRILEHGYKMGIVKGDFQNLGVNTLEELEVVREIYRKKERGET